MYQKYLKRTIDIILVLIGLVLLFPFFIVLIFILSILNNGKPLFYQQRLGKNSKLFTIIKFRTMVDKKNELGQHLSDIQRTTPIGFFLRKYSLDELPNLWNVLMGDMSIVGPRPLPKEYLPLYSPEQARRYKVRPGITGWAQVNGRNSISWFQKIEMDIWYIDNLSFLLDSKILFQTFKMIFCYNENSFYEWDNF